MENVIRLITSEEEIFFKSDIWDLKDYPNEDISNYFKVRTNKYRILDFSIIKSNSKKEELKLFFKAVFTDQLRLKYTIENFYHYFGLPYLANSFKDDSFLNIPTDHLIEDYKEIIKKYGYQKNSYVIIKGFQKSLYKLLDTRTMVNKDIWDLNEFTITPERLNKSRLIYELNFTHIHNLGNREYVKTWIKYLIGCTELTMSTILHKLHCITLFLNEFVLLNAFQIDSVMVDNLINTWKENKSKNTIIQILRSVNDFYKYICSKNNSDLKSPVLDRHIKDYKYVPADNLVSEKTQHQLLKNLKTLENPYQLMFLIIYCTGIRVSDVCQLKRDGCISKETDELYLLHYHCQKMRKQCANAICKALYDKIKDYKTSITIDTPFLFPAIKNPSNPISPVVYVRHINKWVRENNITNDDGTPYQFAPHSFRHTLATDLLQNYDVDMKVIQLGVLKHASMEMSLTYAQRDIDYTKALYNKYYSNYGEIKPLDIKDSMILKRKALSNGYCNSPNTLKTCPYSFECLKCDYFRTSIDFLDIHKKHLENLQNDIEFFKKNNLQANLSIAQETEKILINIITSLEGNK